MKNKKLKIFCVAWHVGHQYELVKLAQKYPVEFYFLINKIRTWGDISRPCPESINWVSYYEKGKYDLAILNLDSQCTREDIGKGKLYRALNEEIQDIPKIVINHATPMIPEYGYDEDIVINGGEVFSGNEKLKVYGLKEMIGDNFMVVNSYEAVERNKGGYPIIHGMDSSEWYDLPKEPRVVTVLSPGGYDKYYNRQLLDYVKTQLNERYGIRLFQFGVDFKPQNWNEYREFLGRSLVHFYPGFDSPMPRGRTEAMLSGCCSVTTKYHGADKFTFTGFNGFVVPDNPLAISDLIDTLIYEGFKYAEDVGRMGKITAKKIFKLDRYLDTWWKVINCVLDNGTIKAQEILNKEWGMYEVFEPARQMAQKYGVEMEQ